MEVKNWNIEAVTGYKPLTNLYRQFSLTEIMEGTDGVKRMYECALEDVKSDYRKLTELVMVLNWKSWEHADEVVATSPMCKLYISLYNKATSYVAKHLKGDELDYYYRVTD